MVFADQDQRLAVPHVRKVHVGVIVGQQAHGADRRCRRNGRAIGLVVEADVPAHDREIQFPAGQGHAVNGPDDLAHDLGALGISEIQVVGDGDRISADGGQIAPGLGHGLFAAFVGVVLDVARRAIGSDRQALAGAVDAHDPGVGAGG